MDISGIKRLGGNTNAVVVQLQERTNPGVVIQGDSLNNLILLAKAVRSEFANGNTEEAILIVQEMEELLLAYQHALNHLE